MKIKVNQRPDKGFFGGPKSKEFNVRYNEYDFEIGIQQMGEREITVTCSDPCEYKDYLGVYYHVVSLLMLFDGRFFPITRAFENDIEITDSMKKRALASYSSADFMFYKENKLVDFENVISEQLCSEWYALKEELDINYKMVLYCLSSVEIPTDVKCAFMIESFIGLSQIVHERRPEFTLPKIKKGDSKLKEYIKTLFLEYGEEVFGEEISRNLDGFASILVESRNRIAHIRKKRDRIFFDDDRNVFYTLKLSLLYRRVIFELIGIPLNQYKDCLLAMVNRVNEHNTVRNFIDGLGKEDAKSVH